MDSLEEIIKWLKDTSEGLQYGEISVKIIKHQGKIVNAIMDTHETVKYKLEGVKK